MKKKTSAIVVIGNEILSGRTQDANINFIAKAMTKKGIDLTEVRVVPDVETLVVEAVDLMRSRYDYVFTTGGIGPTHDDITAECIAKVFNVPIELNKQAHQSLLDYYKDPEKLNDARIKMAMLPVGAKLIKNPVTGAPGFQIENVYVMAGVPNIMRSMLENILPSLEGGIVLHSISVATNLVESKIAGLLGDTQAAYEGEIDIGSYPTFYEGIPKVSAVIRGADKALVEKIASDLQGNFKAMGGSILEVVEL
ncbi:MAG: competence/damage-inducible protein A [Micavibrio sp.]|nr:competence/damage-inducible protein A [Micavibrio sp.]